MTDLDRINELLSRNRELTDETIELINRLNKQLLILKERLGIKERKSEHE